MEQSILDIIWVTICTSLVFLMQAGFLCLEAGIARAKNSINIAIKNVVDFIFSVSGFWLIGFGLMFGESVFGIFGSSYFLFSTESSWQMVFFVFQAVFVSTASTINSGAISGRAKFGTYLILCSTVSIIIYPIFGHWAWAGLLLEQKGWLENLGFIDFAGSTVVHSIGGWVALAGVIVIGPRIGKFSKDGTPNQIPPHNMTMAYLGTFILFFGWFGFNAGSTLSANKDIPMIIINTLLAGNFGGLSAFILGWHYSKGKPHGEIITNGILGGLVSITAGCATVTPIGAIIIGFIGGIICFYGIRIIEHVFKLDDVVGAIGVHAFCGAWGTIALAFFMPTKNLGDVSRIYQIGVQCLGVIVAFIWSFGITYLLLKFFKSLDILRVSPEDELKGLNVSEHDAKMTWLDTVNTMESIIKTGDFSKRVEVELGTEDGAIASEFNYMLDELEKTSNIILDIANGKLNHKTKTKGEKDILGQAINNMLQNLTNIISATSKSSNSVHNSIKNLSKSVHSLVENNNISTQNIQESIHAVMKEIDYDAKKTEESIETAVHEVKYIQNQMQKDLSKAKDVGKYYSEIEKISKTIHQISLETKILSINANLQAGAAGEAGKSFRVIADEIRALAENTTKASKEITDVIEDARIGSQVAYDSLDKSQTMLNSIGDQNTVITQGIIGMKKNLSIAFEKIGNLSNNTNEKTMELMKSVSDIANELVTKMNTLQHSIDYFQK